MSFGFNGKVLHVDLNNHTIDVEEPPEAFYRKYGGGTGMASYYLLKMMPPGIDPLDPQNILAVFIGPATGAAVSGQSRVAVVAKSPLTRGIGDSQAGGFFPATFKRTGFDGLVISGRAANPVYLWIHDGKAEIRDAVHLWGKITGEVEDALKEELDDSKIEVMQIGPAGEKLARLSNIINMCNRANGRTGMGAVMGSKNLKAIVIQGGQPLPMNDTEALKGLARWGASEFKNSDVFGLGVYGTANVLAAQEGLGGLPTRNWTSGHFEEYKAITGKTMADTILKERDTCYACVVRCKRVVEVSVDNFDVDPKYGGPEYETIATFGSYLGISDLPAIAKANELCNKYGLDTISCGATIAWAMDCFEHGLIGLEDTGGIALEYGDAPTLVRLVEMIGKREGFGDLLADGSAKAAEKFGPQAQDRVVAVKNLELPAHMPEVKRSLGLIYAVNAFGADHQSSEHDTSFSTEFSYKERMAEIGLHEPQPLRDLGEEKVHYSQVTQWVYSACNSLSVCQFVYGPAWHLFSTSQLVDLIKASTGWDFSINELLQIGERTVNLQRVFNLREGLTSADDNLPKKLFKARKGGKTDGVVIPPEQIGEAIQAYYQMSGWNEKGVPSSEKLEELGLAWTTEYLQV
jgi:aldehyde:ferredoxin oxidoreductase